MMVNRDVDFPCIVMRHGLPAARHLIVEARIPTVAVHVDNSEPIRSGGGSELPQPAVPLITVRHYQQNPAAVIAGSRTFFGIVPHVIIHWL
jgi:hypothetical protein